MMLKKLLLVLICLSLSLAWAVPDSTSGTQPDPREILQTEPFGQFQYVIRGIIITILGISLISLFRIFMIRRQNKKTAKPGADPAQGSQKPPQNLPPKRSQLSLTMVFLILMISVVVYHVLTRSTEQITKAPYNLFQQQVALGDVAAVQFSEKDIYYTDQSGKKYVTVMPFEDPRLVDSLVVKDATVTVIKPSRWAGILSYFFPFILLIGFWWFFMRGMNSQNNKAFSFGKSKAKLHEATKSRVTFKDVAGVDEAKEELQEIVEFLKDPKKFQRLGGRIPRGVLLVGRPGTGKTLLAKAVSGEAGVPFFSISGSDFVEMFVGVGAARVRDLFEQAKKHSPCITFIDEIDAVGRHRGTGLGGGHDEREQTLNQLLVEMDGFEPNEAVIIIAATNRPDILDPALLRPGRFDRQVTVDLPDIKGRTEILRVHAAKVPLAENVALELIARGTPGFSGADLANIVNEAALIAASHNKKSIEMSDFEEAKDKLTLGKEKKSRVIPEEDKKITAYHEIGHVLTSIFQDKTEPVHKVSIIPRGFTGGATHYLMSDKSGYSRSYLNQLLVTMMGGRAAEEIIFNELTTGAGNDIERITDIAKKMVCSWGMSDKVGPMTLGKEQNEVFLGKDLGSRDVHSNETALLIDSEIRKIISDAHERALQILKDHAALLEVMAKALLDKETMGTDEIFELILENISEADRSLVQAKFDRAREMRFDYPDAPMEAATVQTEEAGDSTDESTLGRA